MIIRRIREHVSAHKWFAVGIDLLVAILGVFVGIQVSNWNEARGQRAQSREDRQRLIADLRSNEIDYANRLQYFRAAQAHAKAALIALGKPSAVNGEAFLIDAYQASQIQPREAKHVTYDEIVATGRLTRLGNPALRDQVGNYYITLGTTGAIMDNVPPYRERLRRAMPAAIQVAIRARCPERYEFLRDGTGLTTLPDRCTLGLEPAMIAAGVNAVRMMPDAAQELNRLIGDLDVKIEFLSINQPRISTLRGRVAAAEDEQQQ